MAKKMTIVEQYGVIIDKVKDMLTEEELKFLKDRADLHAKKNANRKPTKAQEENEAIKEQIVEFLKDGKSYTVGEIQKAVGLESNQKTSALVRQLKNEQIVIRVEEKGKAYFSLA